MIVVQDSKVKIIRLELAPFGTNAYVVICQATMSSMVVDVPGDVDKILDQLNGTEPKYIVITHNHFDHIQELKELSARLKVPVAVHPDDGANLRPSPDIELHDGEYLALGELKFKILHTPGHTHGSICLLMDKYLLSGDTIFPGGPGKTGTPANFKEIVNSLVTKIFTLPDDTEVYPGHGTSTLVGKAKEEFAVFESKSHAPDIHGDVLWLSS